MTLSQKQRKFTKMLNVLHAYAALLGYELTQGRGHVPGAKLKSGKPSLHSLKLAHDLNLFINGRYMTSTEAHRPLGLLWESIGGSWGGRFEDGNHYSLMHAGVR